MLYQLPAVMELLATEMFTDIGGTKIENSWEIFRILDIDWFCGVEMIALLKFQHQS